MRILPEARRLVEQLVDAVSIPSRAQVTSQSGIYADPNAPFQMVVVLAGPEASMAVRLTRADAKWSSSAVSTFNGVYYSLNLNSIISDIIACFYRFHLNDNNANDWLGIQMLWHAVFPVINGEYVYGSDSDVRIIDGLQAPKGAAKCVQAIVIPR